MRPQQHTGTAHSSILVTPPKPVCLTNVVSARTGFSSGFAHHRFEWLALQTMLPVCPVCVYSTPGAQMTAVS